ncbi:MAG: L,D-transpeptidase family protein [Salinivirgaceae bacterium]|nr:L,D-transpeptidase family protein [Salinivirgaceae bacterium]
MMVKLFTIFIFYLFVVSCSTTNSNMVETKYEQENNTIKEEQSPAISIEDISDSIKYMLNTNLKLSKLKPENYFSELITLYQRNNYHPFWVEDSLKSMGYQMLLDSDKQGFNPIDYFIFEIGTLINLSSIDSGNSILKNVELDLLLTSAILKYSDHLLKGKINPYELDSHWNYPNDDFNSYDSVLFTLLKKGQITEIEQFFEPKLFGYKHLKLELAKYRRLNTINTEKISIKYPGFLIQKGDSNEYVLPLKKKLAQLNLYSQDSLSLKFDDSLELAVIKFQSMHGLTPDGLPGRKTYMYLEWQIQDYINALIVNLERIRCLPKELSGNRVEVNIPSYSLHLFNSNEEKINTKIIVGKFKTKTPVFQSAINYLVFNPCWTIPNSIASKKMLPKLKNDSSFLENRNMFITKNGVRIPQDSIDFLKYSENYFPYKIFQNAGPNNALGKVKFMFPNPYQVYLHDTPSKNLFNKDIRAFSNGCVRIENAMKVAETILLEMDKHKYPLKKYLDKGYPDKVYLKNKIELDILYQTVTYDSRSHQTVFFKDIYYFDAKVLKLLN